MNRSKDIGTAILVQALGLSGPQFDSDCAIGRGVGRNKVGTRAYYAALYST